MECTRQGTRLVDEKPQSYLIVPKIFISNNKIFKYKNRNLFTREA